MAHKVSVNSKASHSSDVSIVSFASIDSFASSDSPSREANDGSARANASLMTRTSAAFAAT